MTYFYEYELILAGIILLSAMAFGGVRLWIRRKKAHAEHAELEEQKEPDSSY